MKCDKVHELLLTDFLDAQMDKALAQEVAEHLKECEQCREFERVVHDHAVEPFANTPDQKPPVDVWRSISEAIDREEAKKHYISDTLREYVRGFFDMLRTRRPAVAFIGATVMALVIVVAVSVRQDAAKTLGAYFDGHVAFLSSLNTDTGAGDATEDPSLGTTIEHYFL